MLELGVKDSVIEWEGRKVMKVEVGQTTRKYDAREGVRISWNY